ncbi:hypothetical protein ACS0PU_009730 [Formica fusca]
MAIYMAGILLFGNEEDNAFEPQNQVMRVTRKLLRDASNPFAISDNEFRNLYRLTKDTSRLLIEELVPLMPEIVRRKTVIPHELQYIKKYEIKYNIYIYIYIYIYIKYM